MARIGQVSLEMGRKMGSPLEFADVRTEISFTQREIEENLEYTVQVLLVEQNDALDMRVPLINGDQVVFSPIGRGKWDEVIRQFRPFKIRPDGRRADTIEIREEFEIGDQESGDEEYWALVLVVPEISEAVRWSNRVQINLG